MVRAGVSICIDDGEIRDFTNAEREKVIEAINDVLKEHAFMANYNWEITVDYVITNKANETRGDLQVSVYVPSLAAAKEFDVVTIVNSVLAGIYGK